MSESRTLARERGITAGAWREKGGLYSEERRIPREGKQSRACVDQRDDVVVRASASQSVNLGFIP